MTYLKYVPYEDIEAYHRLGWMVSGPSPGHHAEHGVIMVWPCSCDPKTPPKEKT